MWFKKENKEKKKTPRKRWTKEDEKTLLNALLTDASFKDISKVLGRDLSAVERKHKSIEKARRSGSWNAHETLNLIVLWNNNSSLEAIGQTLNRRRNSIKGRFNTLPGYPNKINEEFFKLVNEKELNSQPEPPSTFTNSVKGVSEEVVQYAIKGYELEHISEQTGLAISNIEKIMDQEEVWDKYDLLMLKKAEKRWDRPLRLGEEKSSIGIDRSTWEQEKQKRVLYLQRVLQNPEGSTIEFKETFGRNIYTKKHDEDLVHAVLKNVCGFLNTQGGDLIIGINDRSRDVVGIDFDFFTDVEDYIRKVSDSIANNFHENPIRYCQVFIEELGNKKVCYIKVGPGTEPSFLVHKKWNISKKYGPDHEIYYTRQGDSAIPLELRETMLDLSKNFPNSEYFRQSRT